MDRRTFLGTLGAAGVAGLAGCARYQSAGPPTTTRPTTTGDVRRRVSVAEQDAVPEQYQVTIGASMTEATSTVDHPATVAVTVTNTGPKRLIGVGTDLCGPFDRSRGLSDPTGLWLQRPGTGRDAKKPRKWEWNRSADRPLGFASYGCSGTVYDRGASETTTYEVWSDYRVDGYLEPGTYRFEHDGITVAAANAAAANGTSGGRGATTAGVGTTSAATGTIDWGFSLRVARPGG